MNKLSRSLALVIAGAFSTLMGAQAAPWPMRAETIHLYNGEVKILPVSDVRRVAVGNGKLLSVTNLPKQLIMIGTGVGDTNMLVWNKRGAVMAYNIDVSADDTRQMATNLRESLAGIDGLHVQARGGQVVLSGDVTADAEKQIGLAVQNLKGNVINLTHAVTVEMKRMVYLDVQVVDFKKSVLKNLGINWQQSMAGPVLGVVGSAIDNPYYHIGDLTQGGRESNQLQGNGGPLTGLPNQMPFSRYFGITTSLGSVINLAVQNGDAYILANPQLSTRSGGDATFLAGGEVPIPVSSALGQTTVTYKNYGVQLNIKPMADRFGNIEASVDTEVSQIDPSVVIDGYPGFLTRKTSSVVNVHSGQTIVMSGLVQATGSNTLTKFPWLGDVPIIGALFRDRNFQADRDELVIFVTPVVFNPHSKVNHEAVNRGTDIARKFNKSDMGRPVWMPGFGVGPAAHLPNPNPPPKARPGKVMTAVQPTPAKPSAPVTHPAVVAPATSAAAEPSAPVPSPAQTHPLGSSTPATSAAKPVWIIGRDNKQQGNSGQSAPAPATTIAGGLTLLVPSRVLGLRVHAPASASLGAPLAISPRWKSPVVAVVQPQGVRHFAVALAGWHVSAPSLMPLAIDPWHPGLAPRVPAIAEVRVQPPPFHRVTVAMGKIRIGAPVPARLVADVSLPLQGLTQH